MTDALLKPTTEEEAQKVNEFRSSPAFVALADEFKDSVIMQEAHHDDRLIVRTLRARNLDLEKSLQMFREMLQWRRTFGTDEALKWKFPQIDKVKEFYPHGFHKFSKCGMPVYIGRVGRLNAADLLNVYDLPDLIRIHVQAREYARSVLFPRASERSNALIDQQITILDLKGMSLSQVVRKVYEYIQDTAIIDQNYYPEILSKMFIINAPTLFSAIWKVVKHWVEERVQKKIIITSQGYKSELLELIDADALPDFLGGTCTSFLNTTEEMEIRNLAK